MTAEGRDRLREWAEKVFVRLPLLRTVLDEGDREVIVECLAYDAAALVDEVRGEEEKNAQHHYDQTQTVDGWYVEERAAHGQTKLALKAAEAGKREAEARGERLTRQARQRADALKEAWDTAMEDVGKAREERDEAERGKREAEERVRTLSAQVDRLSKLDKRCGACSKGDHADCSGWCFCVACPHISEAARLTAAHDAALNQAIEAEAEVARLREEREALTTQLDRAVSSYRDEHNAALDAQAQDEQLRVELADLERERDELAGELLQTQEYGDTQERIIDWFSKERDGHRQKFLAMRSERDGRKERVEALLADVDEYKRTQADTTRCLMKWEDRCGALEKALREYGHHRSTCGSRYTYSEPCSCGLVAALQGTEPKTEEPEQRQCIYDNDPSCIHPEDKKESQE